MPKVGVLGADDLFLLVLLVLVLVFFFFLFLLLVLVAVVQERSIDFLLLVSLWRDAAADEKVVDEEVAVVVDAVSTGKLGLLEYGEVVEAFRVTDIRLVEVDGDDDSGVGTIGVPVVVLLGAGIAFADLLSQHEELGRFLVDMYLLTGETLLAKVALDLGRTSLVEEEE